MDNLGSHKVAGIRAAIEAAGAQLWYLPPYSPDFIAIEQVVAKLKTGLRKTAARTVETLWSAIGTLRDQFNPPSSNDTCAIPVTSSQGEIALAVAAGRRLAKSWRSIGSTWSAAAGLHRRKPWQ
jgi:hypothetical protein